MKILGKNPDDRTAVAQLTYDEWKSIMQACGIPPAQRNDLLEVTLIKLTDQNTALVALKTLISDIDTAVAKLEDIKDTVQAVLTL